ncbi:MAG: AAA family ATPase [Clostridia bacterium]|nr:AAA family ATPase [Clostridia bacterium]
MNILEAKNEIKSAIRIYLEKDENGDYLIPDERQRPVFLIGAPGIGKTAIMSSIASELDIGYIGYTITHHTRQSAIGLPFISQKEFGGQTYSVTEYTMSEIVASVYEAIEKQGKKEGILFIDEINCVSETLAPAMLELLQRKKFGPHKIPNGWILTAAGNPEEYNKSVNELDMVTLDRVKKIVVEPDYDAFKTYAYNSGIHDSVISFLSLNNQYLFKAERSANGFYFVTPRGWEDLSIAIREYERLKIEVTEQFVSQYVQHPQAAAEFIRFYKIYNRFEELKSGEKIENGEVEKTDLSGDNFEVRYALAEILRAKAVKIAEKASQKLEAIEYMEDVISKAKKDGQVLLEETGTLIKELNSSKWNRYKKSAYKPIIDVFESQNYSVAGEKYKQECNVYASKAITKIANILSFGEKSLGQSQEFIAITSGMIANENFISLITNVGWESIYHYFEGVDGSKAGALKDKARRLLKG